MAVIAPRPFPGTEEEARSNRASHWFDWEELRCMNCDCRPSGAWANWPCGVNPEEVGYVKYENGVIVGPAEMF